MAHNREAEGGGMCLGDANRYHCLEVDRFHWIPNGGNSRVAHDRKVESGGMSPRDANIYDSQGVD